MRNPMRTFRLVTVPVILSCALAGGDPATAQETPPPPPTEPEAVEVQLGDIGGTVTLGTTADGGWIRDGESFACGTTVQGGTDAATGLANEYELPLADGTWRTGQLHLDPAPAAGYCPRVRPPCKIDTRWRVSVR